MRQKAELLKVEILPSETSLDFHRISLRYIQEASAVSGRKEHSSLCLVN
jgi:hypothetical protein